MLRALPLVAMVSWASWASLAWGDEAPVGGRAAGRAGVGVVASDGGAALHYNPAGLARRREARVELGLGLHEQDASFASGETWAEEAPRIDDRAGVAVEPFFGAVVGIGDRVVLGAAVYVPVSWHIAAATPGPDLPTADDRAILPHRYAGSRFELTRRTAALGAAVRVLPWLAVGAAAHASQISLTHGRTLWAGTPAGGLLLPGLDPAYDMGFVAAADDDFVLGGALGVVAAPPDAPVEVGASLAFVAAADLAGAPTLRASRGVSGADRLVSWDAADARARLTLPPGIDARAGARFLAGRVAVEADVELHLTDAVDPAWRLEGVGVVPLGQAATPVTELPLDVGLGTSFALRAALDVDIVPDAFTLSFGYAFEDEGALRTRQTLLRARAGHVLAVGLSARVRGGAASLGVSRTERAATSLAVDASSVLVRDPRGDLTVPAAGGRYDGAATNIALTVELSY